MAIFVDVYSNQQISSPVRKCLNEMLNIILANKTLVDELSSDNISNGKQQTNVSSVQLSDSKNSHCILSINLHKINIKFDVKK